MSNDNQKESKAQKQLEYSSVQVHQPATVKNATESNFRAEKGYKMVKEGDCILIKYLDIEFHIPLSNVILAVIKR